MPVHRFASFDSVSTSFYTLPFRTNSGSKWQCIDLQLVTQFLLVFIHWHLDSTSNSKTNLKSSFLTLLIRRELVMLILSYNSPKFVDLLKLLLLMKVHYFTFQTLSAILIGSKKFEKLAYR